MGADSICIKDMAGLLKPYDAYELVKTLKASTSLPVQLHTHYTAGLASMTLLKAAEAGVDVVDTAISPMAMGTSQPPTETFVAAVQGTPYDTGLDLGQLNKISKHFAPLREKYLASGQLNPKALAVDVNALLYQVPGGMLSNLMKQLSDAGRSHQLTEVLEEVPRVRADVGYPPLVTPSSQIVGTQAVYNVIMGERYKMVTKEFRGLVRGDYGRSPVAIDPAFIKQIIGDEEPITCRPADLIEPELEKMRLEMAQWYEQEEDVLTYAQFGQVAVKFFEQRRNKKYGVDGAHYDAEKQVHPV
jgi:oxaloacetate decarboxylase alpha subunit